MPELAAIQAPLRQGKIARPKDCHCGDCGAPDPLTCEGDYDLDWLRTRCPMHTPWWDEPFVEILVKTDQEPGSSTGNSQLGPHAVPMRLSSHLRAIYFFGYNPDLSGGGRVAWGADQLPALVRARLRLAPSVSGVVFEVYVSRIPRVLDHLRELRLPIVAAIVPASIATAEIEDMLRDGDAPMLLNAAA